MTARCPLFTPVPADRRFGPRTGVISLDRGDGTAIITLETPTLLTATSRGLVPHLSRDNVHLTEVIRSVQLPFESFLDRNPPVPTIVGGSHPLHTYLGYDPDKHIVFLTLRDPSDGRKMPPNGNDFVSAQCTRGVRKVQLSAWKTYAQTCKPDLVVALSDTPFTPPPHSQKRLTKSIERSIKWLSDLLKVTTDSGTVARPPGVLVHLAGGTEPHARGEFAERLTDPIEAKDAAGLSPLKTLDDGVSGYVFDLLPLHASLMAEASRPTEPPSPLDEMLHLSDSQRSSPDRSARLAELLQASLRYLPSDKPRVVNSPASPHEILHLVRDVGVDVIDGFWAQRAADIGIALDFSFPVPSEPIPTPNCPPPRSRQDGRLDLGHNLFDSMYRHDHSRLASTFVDGMTAEGRQSDTAASYPVCSCSACSPRSPSSRLLHSAVDIKAWEDPHSPKPLSTIQRPFTRSYIHHLLHTHEMSSHSLLAMHNLTVFSAFLAGIRAVISRQGSSADELAKEITRFEDMYDETMTLWDEAKPMWLEVEHARGKGRLSREKEKQVASTVGTAVDL